MTEAKASFDPYIYLSCSGCWHYKIMQETAVDCSLNKNLSPIKSDDQA